MKRDFHGTVIEGATSHGRHETKLGSVLNKNMKDFSRQLSGWFGSGIFALALVLSADSAKANLIVNGDFQAGSTGFSSDYTSTATQGIGTDAGTYDVVNNPFGPPPPQNPYISSGYYDHTLGTASGLMLAVNGATDASQRAWYQTVSGLTVGTQYRFSFYLSNWSFDPVANLQVNIGTGLGALQQSGVYALATSGSWQQESFLWTANANSAQFAISDLQTAASGNDFALDDISLVAVPEPTTMIAGALLLLPFGLGAFRSLHRKETA